MTSTAKYLQLNPLYDLTCHAIARIIEGKLSEEIRDIFYSPDDHCMLISLNLGWPLNLL